MRACSRDSEVTMELPRQQQKGVRQLVQANHDMHQLLPNFSPLTHNMVSCG